MTSNILPQFATKNTYSLIWYFVKRRPLLFIFYQICALGTALDLIVWPLLIAYFTNILYDIELAKNLDLMTQAFSVCKKAIIMYVLLIILSHLLLRAKAYLMANFVVPKLEYDISSKMTEYILNREQSFFIDMNSTELVSRIEMLANNSCVLIENCIGILIPNLFAAFWLAGSMFYYHWTVGVCVVSSVIIHFLILVLLTPKISQIMTINSNAYNTLIAKMSDTFYNISSVKAFANKLHEVKLVKIFFNRYMNTHVKSIMLTEKMNWAFTITHIILIGGGFIYLIVHLFSISKISADSISYALFAVNNLLYCIWLFSDALPRLFVEIGFCNETITSLCNPTGFERIEGDKITFKTGKIEIKNMCFGYNDQDLLFENYNLNIKDKEKIGLVGFSGSGKTSLTNLITGNFNILSGYIKIDGHDISKLPHDVIRENITVIPQEPTLFNRSILENIRYGKINATFDEVVAAAKMAYAHDFILDMDNGYHTTAADRGARLSGGQKQRIAIARAIIKDSPIIILDEITSALDKKNEKNIQDSIFKLIENKTAIIIAHKLETIVKMNRILVMNHGKIMEEGTHEELLKNSKSYYSKMWNIGKEAANGRLII